MLSAGTFRLSSFSDCARGFCAATGVGDKPTAAARPAQASVVSWVFIAFLFVCIVNSHPAHERFT